MFPVFPVALLGKVEQLITAVHEMGRSLPLITAENCVVGLGALTEKISANRLLLENMKRETAAEREKLSSSLYYPLANILDVVDNLLGKVSASLSKIDSQLQRSLNSARKRELLARVKEIMDSIDENNFVLKIRSATAIIEELKRLNEEDTSEGTAEVQSLIGQIETTINGFKLKFVVIPFFQAILSPFIPRNNSL